MTSCRSHLSMLRLQTRPMLDAVEKIWDPNLSLTERPA